MFTGIVEELGEVVAVEPLADAARRRTAPAGAHDCSKPVKPPWSRRQGSGRGHRRRADSPGRHSPESHSPAARICLAGTLGGRILATRTLVARSPEARSLAAHSPAPNILRLDRRWIGWSASPEHGRPPRRAGPGTGPPAPPRLGISRSLKPDQRVSPDLEPHHQNTPYRACTTAPVRRSINRASGP